MATVLSPSDAAVPSESEAMAADEGGDDEDMDYEFPWSPPPVPRPRTPAMSPSADLYGASPRIYIYTYIY